MKKLEQILVATILGIFAVNGIVKLITKIYEIAIVANTEDFVFMIVFILGSLFSVVGVLWWMYFNPKRKNEVSMPTTGIIYFIFIGIMASVMFGGIAILIVRIISWFS